MEVKAIAEGYFNATSYLATASPTRALEQRVSESSVVAASL